MKKSIHISTLLLIGVLIFSSCRKEEKLSDTEMNSDAPVIEAYLLPGDTPEVKVSKLLPYSEDEDVSQEPVSGLTISLISEGKIYTSTEDSNAGSYLFDEELIIEDGKQYNLEFLYKDFVIKAETVVPSKPVEFSVSTENIYVSRVIPGQMGMSAFDPIELTWNNSDNSYYILRTEYLETELDFINANMASNDMDFPTSNTTTPILGDAYSINSRSVLFFGTYRLILYKINQEYVDLYETIGQNSNSLTNPLTNIENGWGIFTGLNADTLFLEVKEL